MVRTTAVQKAWLVGLLAVLMASHASPGSAVGIGCQPLLGSNVWTSIGPGGSIRALAIDPATPTTLYAGVSGGGVFKSTNGGESWSAINTGLDPYVEALAIDPATPTTLYAGTYSGGVFKSTNGGKHWSAVNAGLTCLYVLALAVDPATPTTLYAGTYGGGVCKTTDRGESWSAVNAGLTNLDVSALAIDPVTPTTLYAGTNVGGVCRTTDGGESWSAVNTGLTDLCVHALVIDPATPTTLYAGTYGVGDVFKSTDGGESWSVGSTCLSEVNALLIDPATPTTLYVGTFAGVCKSTDGGESWSAINTGLTDLDVLALAIDPATPTTLYAGTNGGVFKSIDVGGLQLPEVDVQGKGVSIVNGDSTPSAADDTDFGSAGIATGAVDHTFTICNAGAARLSLTGSPRVVMGGAHASDFRVTLQPTSPVASGGGTAMFTVRFNPSALGVRAATISITNDDADENPYTFSIQGTGMPPARGDIDGNDVVDMLDVRICLQIAAGYVTGTPEQLYAADFDGDGDVDLEDARALAGYVIRP